MLDREREMLDVGAMERILDEIWWCQYQWDWPQRTRL
jgi:hypothetical protein